MLIFTLQFVCYKIKLPGNLADFAIKFKVIMLEKQ